MESLTKGFMMKLLLIVLPLYTITLLASPSSAGKMHMPPYEGSSALKAMKTLAGTWTGTHIMEGKEIPASVDYKVSSNGSAVVETMFPGTSQEMVTVYHDKGGKLAMTHYCSVGNQPHLDLVTMEGNILAFSLSSSGNAHLGDEGHMHDLTVTISDSDHLQQEWSYFEKGKYGGTTTFTLVRVQ